MKTFLKFIPILFLMLISFYPLFKSSQISTTLIDSQEEKSSLPGSAKDVIVMVIDFTSSPGNALDQTNLSIVYEIHKEIQEMEGIRGFSSIFNTPVVIALEDEILVLPFIHEELLTFYDKDKIISLISQYNDFPEIWPYISSDFLQCVFYLEPGRTYPSVRLIENIEKLKDKKEKEHNLSLDFTGLRPIRLFNERFLTQDILRILPILLVIISLLYYIVFRDIRILLFSWFIKIIATTSAFGCYMVFFKEISPLIIIIPVFNIGLLSDYLIHMFYHTQDKIGPDSFYKARNYLAIPLSLTALTSIIGFLSLILFESSGHLLLACTISVSILLTYLLTILLIPSLNKITYLSIKPIKRVYRSILRKIRRKLTIFFLGLYKYRIVLFIVIILLLIISAFNLQNLTLQPYPLKQLPSDTTIIKAENILNEKFSGTVPFMFEIDTGSAGSLLNRKNLFIIEDIHHTIYTNKDIGFQHSFLTILKKIHFYFNNSDPEYYNIPDVEDEWAFSSMIEQYLLFFSASTSPEEYESLVDPDYRIASIKGILKYKDLESITRILTTYKNIKNNLPSGWSISLLGPLKELVSKADNLKSNWLLSFTAGSFLIFFTVLIFFRDIKMSFLGLVPSFAILLIVTGLAPILGIKIDEYTIIFIAITTGLTIDYTIHILNAIKKIKNRTSMKSNVQYGFQIVKSGGVPVFLSFLTSVIAFAMLFLSSFSGAVHLAIMLILAISCALFIGVFILPMFFVPKNIGKIKPPVS